MNRKYKMKPNGICLPIRSISMKAFNFRLIKSFELDMARHNVIAL